MSLESIPKFVWCSIASLIVSFTVLVCLFSYQVLNRNEGDVPFQPLVFRYRLRNKPKSLKIYKKYVRNMLN